MIILFSFLREDIMGLWWGEGVELPGNTQTDVDRQIDINTEKRKR